MIRLSLAFMIVVCAITSGGIIFAQGDFENQGGTIRGQIVDTTEMQNPIEGVEIRIVGTSGEEYITTTDVSIERNFKLVPFFFFSSKIF